jgi:hypothetical protein
LDTGIIKELAVLYTIRLGGQLCQNSGLRRFNEYQHMMDDDRKLFQEDKAATSLDQVIIMNQLWI